METKVLASVLHLVEQDGFLKFEQVLQHHVTQETVPLQCQWHNAKGSEKQVTWETYNNIDTRSWYIHNDCRYGPHMGVAAPNIEDRQKCDGSKYTYGDYWEKVVHTVLRRHKHTERIICVNDPYDQRHTIKDSESLLRQKNAPISNEISR